MALVTAAEVQAIMPDYPDDLTPFILVAHILVDEELDDTVLSADRLKEIERWLSAHFAAVHTALPSQESAGPVAQTLQRGLNGRRLETTQFGQQAIALDTTGRLKAINEGSAGVAMIAAVQEPFQIEDDE